MNKVVLILLTLGISWSALAQNGKIAGKVIDQNTGEELIGVSVVIDGTTNGASTDLDGSYVISAEPGTYNVTVSYVSFQSKKFNNVVIKAGETTPLNITLAEETQTLNEVVVVAEYERESTDALLVERKNALQVSDGLAREFIAKTPDRLSSDVIKRVSGASIQDNKFAIVRGLNDRYNTAFLNGAPLPSTESDRKAFSFDLFPSNLLDNINIVKTATPDLPADFAGGVIQLKTRDIPTENFFSISAGPRFNTITTFKEFYKSPQGSLDFLGMNDGSRDLPSNLPSSDTWRQENLNSNPIQAAQYATQFRNDWALTRIPSIAPGYSAQINGGFSKPVFGNDFGAIFSITNNNDYSYSQSPQQRFLNPSAPGERYVLRQRFLDDRYSHNVTTGFLLNLAYKLGDNHKFGLKNSLNYTTDDLVVRRGGYRDLQISQEQESSIRWYTNNRLFTSQFTGEHFLPGSKLKIDWLGGVSSIYRTVPSLRRQVYTRTNRPDDPSDDGRTFVAAIQRNGTSTTSGGNFFSSNTDETAYTLKLDLSRKFDQLRTEVKVGAFYVDRQRAFAARELGFTQFDPPGTLRFNSDLLNLPVDQIFDPANLGYQISAEGDTVAGGFRIFDATLPNNSYDAGSVTKASYAMLNNQITERLRLIWGVRMESYNQTLSGFGRNSQPVTVDSTVIDWLPSANLIFSLTSKSNVRLSFSQTVSRPEYRELAPFSFYDYTDNFTTNGNPALERTKITNGDVRYELFPRSGEVISISGFYKHFNGPIERVQLLPNEVTFVNATQAINYGGEVELRTRLNKFLFLPQSQLLSYFTVSANLALIKSEVSFEDADPSIKELVIQKRPLQGQSPYVFNASVVFDEPTLNLSVSASYNRVGPRIFIAGTFEDPTILENPRNVLDLQVSRTFFEKLNLRLNVRDVLANKFIFYYDNNANEKYDSYDDAFIERTVGTGVTFTASYNF
ncbi:TonB-dependent receptor [Catalinimonas alkaloidigena]|uniref:TonB-dependent receptor n=1 Tax=Catalinimonas alkaloidigena TaxID=1075417 RepID=A0A1G9DN33_9BACT|nr:TonB-dependent receptor [Catalinimonas alkaloidigena]SDK65297.1 TonB-dependent receptor [Catalinimonas alkaloidigena]